MWERYETMDAGPSPLLKPLWPPGGSPFIYYLLLVWGQWLQAKQCIPDILLPTPSSSSWGSKMIPGHSQSCEFWVHGVSPPSWMHLKILQREMSRRHPNQVPEHPYQRA